MRDPADVEIDARYRLVLEFDYGRLALSRNPDLIELRHAWSSESHLEFLVP